ncbi:MULTISPECIES: hypothetical protein [Paraburkholderia]|uniref:Conjugal transfer protein n=4 Tax=Paraburkholderia TaxID=1822464 RepID=B2JXW4_PARP8|nr:MULTISPECIES: hypothetical protein [Paraburkholderia]ACC76472.1 hypothetical protein Bphy_7536 [Paraburkholderia phymatum STM815]AFT90422.1 hypothetical protein BUPH_04903 [Paraburkholderia phenoliruptrix BR3459a]MCO4879358.1 hypothetical protein [Paraburkholderia caribensis]PTB24023.1 hypothetical protein C9I56_36215 [Paraburkholderia caribensis]CAB4051834.1 hypothetical protein LMG9964_05513 [Paraburkholderia phenoliruptrix]
MFRKIKFCTIKLAELTDDAACIICAAKSTLLGSVLLAPALALAGGGLDSATEGANTFKIWLYSFLGVCASCVLLWKGAECWADRSHWSEFVTLGGKVAVVGAVVGVLAPYLWNLFT